MTKTLRIVGTNAVPSSHNSKSKLVVSVLELVWTDGPSKFDQRPMRCPERGRRAMTNELTEKYGRVRVKQIVPSLPKTVEAGPDHQMNQGLMPNDGSRLPHYPVFTLLLTGEAENSFLQARIYKDENTTGPNGSHGPRLQGIYQDPNGSESYESTQQGISVRG